MKRIRYTTTIQEDLLVRTKALARTQGLSGANDIIEKALALYFQVQERQIWEKVLPDGKRQRVLMDANHTCIDYIEKRIQVGVVSDPERLLASGYQPTFKL